MSLKRRRIKGHSRNFIKLDDKEVATITVDGRNLDLRRHMTTGTSRINREGEEEEAASPAPYPHWFIKE